jgi:hypothetical protein
MQSNDNLILAYKNMRELIKNTPNDKDNIINEYVDLVEKINNYNNNNNNNNNYNTNYEMQNMLKKNPLEINIYNNFQKYNNPNNDYSSFPIHIPSFHEQNINFSQFRTPEESKQYIIDTTTKYDD